MRRLCGLAVHLGHVTSMHATGHEAMSLLQQATDATHARMSALECRSMQAVTTVEGQTEG